LGGGCSRCPALDLPKNGGAGGVNTSIRGTKGALQGGGETGGRDGEVTL